MTHTDPIADMLARIKNAYMARHKRVEVPYSKIKEEIAAVLKKKNYLKDYKIEGDKKKLLSIGLLYRNGVPVITNIKRISKPGIRIYSNKDNLPRALSGFGTVILTTSKGIMADDEARKKGIGGEVICEVW